MRTFAVSDVHGYAGKLQDSLHRAGLTDDGGDWAGTDARLWFLGDYFDRGPDGIAVVDLVRRLEKQSAGAVRALVGNHEVLALGMHLFGTTEVPHNGLLTRTFERSWLLNGGRDGDQERLTDDHVEWLRGLPVIALDGDHLLMHSDTLEYLDWGDTAEEINATGREILEGNDLTAWWDVWRRMTTRYAFRGPDGEENAQRLMDILGGERIVHGHSVIADQLGIHPMQIEGPYLYAGGKALGVDGGLFVGGPCLVVELPFAPES